MAESVYKVIELVGTSTESWEKAAAAAVNMQLKDGKVEAYRAKVKVSFKYEGGK